ncbi:MAG: hypothetical protein WBA12_11825 [Catalinimonas sp.]
MIDGSIDRAFGGGREAFNKFLEKHLRYPEEARMYSQMGLAVVNFKIGCDTKEPYQIQVLSRLGNGIEKEVLRVLKMSAWKWHRCGEETYQLKVCYTLGETYRAPDADFYVTAHSMVVSQNSFFPTDDELENELSLHLAKKNKKQALLILEELHDRYPLNTQINHKIDSLQPPKKSKREKARR